MLALDAQEGDVAIITTGDDKGPYMLGDGPADVLESWHLLATSPDIPVQSVNGQVGTIVLGPGDVGAAPDDHDHDADDLTDATAVGKALIRAEGAAAARGAIDAAEEGHTHSEYATQAQVEARTPEIRVVSSPELATSPGVLYVVRED
jgi:hypothetical protein